MPGLALPVLAAAASAAVANARVLAGLSPSAHRSAVVTEGLPNCSHGFPHNVIPNNPWRAAALEEGLDVDSISFFGRTVPKVKRSDVEKIMRMSHEPVRNYSFEGRLSPHGLSSIHHERRSWVLPFAARHFGSEDFLKVTDAEAEGWKRLGQYDYSCLETRGGRPDIDLAIFPDAGALSPEYLQVMGSSRYTLCPGGDVPWSWRMVEAIAAGSLPVIKHPSDDWDMRTGNNFGVALQPVMEKIHYALKADAYRNYPSLPLPEEERGRLVGENWRVFITYLTFIEGDNEIPGLQPCLQRDSVDGTVFVSMMLADPKALTASDGSQQA